jgi:hypothetical protein
MSSTSEDFPDPDTPVTAMKMPSGISTVMSRRLWARAPSIVSFACGVIGRRSARTGIESSPLR